VTRAQDGGHAPEKPDQARLAGVRCHLACLAGGLAATLFVTRPLTADVLVNGASEGAIWLLFATIGLVLTLRRPANPRLAALAGDNLWAIGVTLAITLPLPSGRLRSPRWRPVAVASIAATAAFQPLRRR
jgi:hypothetical protein